MPVSPLVSNTNQAWEYITLNKSKNGYRYRLRVSSSLTTYVQAVAQSVHSSWTQDMNE